jgi:hypothetical protein
MPSTLRGRRGDGGTRRPDPAERVPAFLDPRVPYAHQSAATPSNNQLHTVGASVNRQARRDRVQLDRSAGGDRPNFRRRSGPRNPRRMDRDERLTRHQSQLLRCGHGRVASGGGRESGLLPHLAGGLTDGAMVLEGTCRRDGEPVRDRIRWQELPDGRGRRKWRTAAEGGETWERVFPGSSEPAEDGTSP